MQGPETVLKLQLKLCPQMTMEPALTTPAKLATAPLCSLFPSDTCLGHERSPQTVKAASMSAQLGGQEDQLGGVRIMELLPKKWGAGPSGRDGT